MLQLNPNDNQGVRYTLATCLLEDRTPEARAALQELLDRFPEDVAANWAYSRALLFFQLNGQPNPMATQALNNALAANLHVPPPSWASNTHAHPAAVTPFPSHFCASK